jgi:hypothetical protein
MKMRQLVQKLTWMKFSLLICSLVLSFKFPTVEFICFIITPVLCVCMMMMTMTTVTDDDDDDNNNNNSHNMMVLR